VDVTKRKIKEIKKLIFERELRLKEIQEEAQMKEMAQINSKMIITEYKMLKMVYGNVANHYY
jgi:hypothetical protein